MYCIHWCISPNFPPKSSLSFFLLFICKLQLDIMAWGYGPLPPQPVLTCPMSSRETLLRNMPPPLPLAWQHSTFCTVNPGSKHTHTRLHITGYRELQKYDVTHCASTSSKGVNSYKLLDTGLHFIKARIQRNKRSQGSPLICTEAGLYKINDLP